MLNEHDDESSETDDDCEADDEQEPGRNDHEAHDKDCAPGNRQRGYGAWWWTPAWLGATGQRGTALQERILRDHQRQLDDFAKQVASGAYTAQSLVSEVWTFWGRVLGDQADLVRVASGIEPQSGGPDATSPNVFAFRMAEGDESRTFTLRLPSELLPAEEAPLKASALRSRDYSLQLQPESITFKPPRVKRSPRGEQAVEITFAQVGRSGNQFGPGHYLGTLSAGDRVLGLLVLEIAGRGSNLGD